MPEGTITTNYVKFTDGGMVAAYDGAGYGQFNTAAFEVVA